MADAAELRRLQEAGARVTIRWIDDVSAFAVLPPAIADPDASAQAAASALSDAGMVAVPYDTWRRNVDAAERAARDMAAAGSPTSSSSSSSSSSSDDDADAAVLLPRNLRTPRRRVDVTT